MILVTSNEGKFREYESMFLEHGMKVKVAFFSYPEEQLDSIEKVAERSACYLQGIMKEDFFIDDSGLFIESLGGFPGVYSSYVNRTIGNDGILKLMSNVEDRRARFRTCIAYYDGEMHLFTGEVSGQIAYKGKGENGFGFDPIFIPSGYTNTYAEMSLQEKSSISHRSRAAKEFIAFLKKKEI